MLILWPADIVGDYFIPESAVYVVSALQDLDDESAAVSVRLWALDAELEVSEN